MARALRGLAPDVVYNLAPPRTAWHRLRDRAFFAGALGAREYHGPAGDGDAWAPTASRDPAAAASDAPSAAIGAARLDDAPPRAKRAHAAQPEWERLAGIVNGASAPPPRFAPMHYEDAGAPDVVRRVLAAKPDALLRPLIAVAPGSKMQAKRWPAASYRHVVATLADRYPEHRFVVIGDGNDRAIAADVAAATGACIDVSGTLTLRELGALLARCVLFVGNDTGTMHLAALVGVPCVAIFSARDRPLRWEPMGAGHRVLRHDPPCAGCMLETCTRGNVCLTRIAPDDVVAAASDILDAHARIAHAEAGRAAAD
jgi:ADP-heptose:LPS heptosyltransferase